MIRRAQNAVGLLQNDHSPSGQEKNQRGRIASGDPTTRPLANQLDAGGIHADVFRLAISQLRRSMHRSGSPLPFRR